MKKNQKKLHHRYYPGIYPRAFLSHWKVWLNLFLLVSIMICTSAPNLSRAETDISDNFPTVGSVIYHPLAGGYFLITDLGPPFFRDEMAANLSIPGRMATLGYGVPLGGNLYLWLTGPIYIAYVTAYTAGYPGNCDFYFRSIRMVPTSSSAPINTPNSDPGKPDCPQVSLN